MQNLARPTAETKPLLAASSPAPALPWRCLRRSLRTLGPDERVALGRSLDVGDVRLVLGAQGDVFAVRRRQGA